MSGSNCCFLTCIQISQEAAEEGGLVFPSLEEFSTVCCDSCKSFSIWMKQMFFWNSLAFSMFQLMLAIWSLVPLPFLNPASISGNSWLTYCWSLAYRILSITLLACEISATVQQFAHSLVLPFFGIGMKTDLFQSWVFHICWYSACNTFTASSFRILNSSTGILSPPLALFIVMLDFTFQDVWL